MTEKRFMIDDCGTLIDKVTRNTYDYVSDVEHLCNQLWNQTKRFEKHNMDLVEENEQLKSKVDDRQVAVEVETEKVMQKVFEKIDEKIKEYDDLFDEFGINQKKRIFRNVLIELKKELSE